MACLPIIFRRHRHLPSFVDRSFVRCSVAWSLGRPEGRSSFPVHLSVGHIEQAVSRYVPPQTRPTAFRPERETDGVFVRVAVQGTVDRFGASKYKTTIHRMENVVSLELIGTLRLWLTFLVGKFI